MHHSRRKTFSRGLYDHFKFEKLTKLVRKNFDFFSKSKICEFWCLTIFLSLKHVFKPFFDKKIFCFKLFFLFMDGQTHVPIAHFVPPVGGQRFCKRSFFDKTNLYMMKMRDKSVTLGQIWDIRGDPFVRKFFFR